MPVLILLRKRKNVDFCGWRIGEDLGGVWGGKTKIRIHCLKTKPILN